MFHVSRDERLYITTLFPIAVTGSAPVSAQIAFKRFCVRFCVAKHGYFDKFVQIESGGDVDNLIVTDAVFADLEYGGYVLRHTAKMRALC